jgi:hypothetical protein
MKGCTFISGISKFLEFNLDLATFSFSLALFHEDSLPSLIFHFLIFFPKPGIGEADLSMIVLQRNKRRKKYGGKIITEILPFYY